MATNGMALLTILIVLAGMQPAPGMQEPILAPPADLGAQPRPVDTPAAESLDPARADALRRMLRPRSDPRLVRTPVAAARARSEPLSVPFQERPGSESLPPELELEPALDPSETTVEAPLSLRTSPAFQPAFPADAIPLEVMPDELDPHAATRPRGVDPRSARPMGRPGERPFAVPDEGEDSPELDADREQEQRVESELRKRLGRQLRDVNVRIKGRRVWVRADANFLWNRRNVRRTIETLPELAGYRIEADVY